MKTSDGDQRKPNELIVKENMNQFQVSAVDELTGA